MELVAVVVLFLFGVWGVCVLVFVLVCVCV